MDDLNKSKSAKALAAWVVGIICLPGFSYFAGAVVSSLSHNSTAEGVAVVFFFIGAFLFWPCLFFTAVVGITAGIMAKDMKTSILASAVVNLGIVFTLLLLLLGVFPVA